MVGDIYDCVDFYMQPAFDHPLLKNHTFHPEMRPVFTPNEEITHCKPKVIDSMKLKDGGCPKGTVPIRRTSKDDYIRIKRFTSEYAKYNSKGLTPGTHVAILQTNSDPQRIKYHGAGGNLNMYNLSIQEPQFSSGEFIVRNGADQIKIGWTVNPKLNKDNRPHLFQYLDAGGSHCFNTLCPGFVQTSKLIAVDSLVANSSVRGGVQCSLPFLVFQDAKTGDWWFQVCGINVGFWPKQIFSSMSTAATYIGVGGEVYGPPDRPLPPMGNGFYPVNDMFESTYCLHLVVIDENHRSINPPYMETYSDDWHYGIYDVGISGNNGRVIYYGGTTLW